MRPGDRTRVERYWSADLGFEIQELRREGVVVCAHPLDYRGAQLLRHAEVCILAVPPGWLEHARTAADCRADGLFQPEALRRLFGAAVDRVIGPAFVGYPEREAERDAGVVPLTAEHAPLLESLRRACTEREWEYAGIEPGAPEVLGILADGRVACAGSIKLWGEELADLGILTHPELRGRGLGRRVVATMAAAARDQGWVPQYRTLFSNESSLAVGRACGFGEWGRTLAVRLRAWSPGDVNDPKDR